MAQAGEQKTRQVSSGEREAPADPIRSSTMTRPHAPVVYSRGDGDARLPASCACLDVVQRHVVAGAKLAIASMHHPPLASY